MIIIIIIIIIKVVLTTIIIISLMDQKHKTNKVKKEHYLITVTIYTFSIKLSFSSIGQDKSKLQKQIRKLLILFEVAA